GVAAEHGNSGLSGIVHYFAHKPMKLVVGGTPSFGGRNLLGIFYFTRLRRELNRMYAVDYGNGDIDPDLLMNYRSQPTPEGLDRIYKARSTKGLDMIKPENGPATREFMRAVDF